MEMLVTYTYFIVVGIVAVLLLFVVVEIARAFREVKQTDTGKYYVCEKHGPLPAAALIHMDQPTGEPVDTCPICYEEAFRVADQHLRSMEEQRARHSAGNA